MKRVVVVGNNERAAEGVTQGVSDIAATKVGFAVIMYGLCWLIARYTPTLLENDMGVLTYVIAPAAIMLGLFFILVAAYSLSSFEDPLIQFLVSGAITFFVSSYINELGWFGDSMAGSVIGSVFLLVFIFVSMHYIMRFNIVLKASKIIGGILVFGILLSWFSGSAVEIVRAAGWL